MKEKSRKWKLDVRSTFKKSFRNLSNEYKERVLEAINTLQSSDNPEVLGHYLRGEYKGILKYRVGNIRIIYSIDRSKDTLILLDVGKRENIYER